MFGAGGGTSAYVEAEDADLLVLWGSNARRVSYCGNCIGVCPTGALKSVKEHELREDGDWRPGSETVTTTICSFVSVTSPSDHSVTHGHLCIKGASGSSTVQNLPES